MQRSNAEGTVTFNLHWMSHALFAG